LNTLNILRHFFSYRFHKFSSPQRLERWQQRQVLKHLDWVAEHSAYYQGCKGLPLEQWPLMNKSTMMSHFNALNTVGLDVDQAFEFAYNCEKSRDFNKTLNGVAVGLSSGTSGNRGMFIASARERELWAGAILAKLVPDLLYRSHRVGLFLRADSPLYSSVNSRRLAFTFFDMIKPVSEHIAALNTHQPDIIIAPGSVLKQLAERADDLIYRPARLIACAEVFYPDAQLAITSHFGLEVEQIYQCTEGFLACHQQGALRFNEDLVHIEPQWLDEGRTRFKPIITDFRRTSQPIIRYVLDDVIHLGSRQDQVFKHIERIEGRCDDVLSLIWRDGSAVPVYPDFLVRAILFEGAVGDFRIVQLAKDLLHIEAHDRDGLNIERSISLFLKSQDFKVPRFTHGDYARPSTEKNRRVVNRSQ
jgi:putative adenylate-forming enzyme